MKRFLRNSKQNLAEGIERGQASFAHEEAGKIVPTIIQETSMVMDDEEAIEADAQEVDRVAPTSALAADVEVQRKRALIDVETAKTALEDAQDAADEADDQYARLNAQYKQDGLRGAATIYMSNPAHGAPGGPAQSEDVAVLTDRQRVENDLAATSAALADADEARAQADQDRDAARRGGTPEVGPG